MRFRSAHTKIARARELTREVATLLVKQPPYGYFLEINTVSNMKATFSKPDDEALDVIVIRCGEILHNLRSALDHAYWEAVSVYVDESSQSAIQFPFAKEKSKLEQAIKSRLAHKVSEDFYLAIESIRPYAGEGGNTLLNLIHEINIVDKHKFPTPVGDFTRISSDHIRRLVPDFPRGIVNCSFGQCHRDVSWQGAPTKYILAPTYIYKKLDVPVGLVFSIREPYFHAPVIDTLKNMADEVERILNIMSNSLS